MNAGGGMGEGLGQSGEGGGSDHPDGGPSFENIIIFGGIGASAVSGVRKRPPPAVCVQQFLFCKRSSHTHTSET